MDWFENLFDFNKNNCYLEHRDKYGVCHGLVGGSNNSCYLSSDCMDCKHYEMPCHIQPTPFMIYNSKRKRVKVKVNKVKKIEKCLCEGKLPPLYGEE